MSPIHRVTAVLAIFLIAFHSCFSSAMAAGGNETGASAVETRMFYEPTFDPKLPGAALEVLGNRAQKHDLSFEETLDRGTAHFLAQEWDKSAASYEGAVAKAPDRGSKAMAMYYAAQAMANHGNWRQAGQLANQANQLVPESRELAAVRVAFWANAKDQLELKAAQDRVKQVNLKMEGNPVVEPGTIVVLLLLTAWTICYTTLVVTDHEEDADKMVKVTLAVITLGASIRLSGRAT